MKAFAVAFLLLSTSLLAGETTTLEVGSAAPEWKLEHWINSEPLDLHKLRGKVVLVRWWTAPECPYCRATAPALNEFYEQYHDKGLELIGVYHRKIPQPFTLENVTKHVKEYGFKFPVAVDPDWKNVKAWWLGGDRSKWTSVTFLIDREGIIRHIHPGGQYVKGDDAYVAMKNKIEELLSTKTITK